MASTSEAIRADLSRRIGRGEFQPGDQLPSVPALMRTYGPGSRGTVDRALRELEAQGLVRVEHGRGTFVRERELLYRDLVEDVLVEYQLATGGGEPDGSLVGLLTDEPDVRVETSYCWGHAPYQARELLRLDAATNVLGRLWLFRSAGVPTRIVRSYMPAELARQVGLTGPESERPGAGTMAHLAAGGIELGEAEIVVEARMPRDEETRTLGLWPGTPVLTPWRVLYSPAPERRPLEVLTSVAPSDQVAYRVRVPLGDRK